MSRFSNPKVQGAFRHLLSSIGPVAGVSASLIASDTVSPGDMLAAFAAQWELAIVAPVMAVWAFALSWRAKEKQ